MLQNSFDTCIIIHGCPPNEASDLPKNKRWMNWLAEEISKKGLDTYAPDMPTPWKPNYQEWKNTFEKYPVSYSTLLVGHSCGATFLIRWLLETNKHVKK